MRLKKAGQGVYKLRHLFATLADECEDRNAVSRLMGHSLGIKDHYVRVDEARLRKVVEHVRQRLLG
jgi:integrase